MIQRIRNSSRCVDEAAGRPRALLAATGWLAAAAVAGFAMTAHAEDAVPAKTVAAAAAKAEKPTGALAGTLVAGAAQPGEAAATEAVEPVAEAAAERDYVLRARILGTGAIADGDVAQFQQRHRIPENFSGGIDELHFETEIAEDTELELDGRVIFDNHDYLLSLSVKNDDKGFFQAGYREFRTWYDGRGGYFPPSDASFALFNPQLGLDRGEAWARGGLVLPSSFKLTMGYRYLFRDGRKNSVSWGDTSALGLAPPNSRRNIVPSFYDIDENRHQVNVALVRDTGKTQLGSGFYYERTSLDDRRQITREPGNPTLERRLTERDNSDSDLWGSRIHGTHRLLDGKITISGAYAYNDIDLDIAGSRIYGAQFNSQFSLTSPNRQQRDEGFFDLGGSSKLREHVGNFSMLARPFEDVQVLTAVRVRGENVDAHADFVESSVGVSPTFTTELLDLGTFSATNEMSYAEDLEVRYKGIDNLVLYARGQWEQNDGDIYENESDTDLGVIDLERDTDLRRRLQKYAGGTKYYPLRWLNVSTEYSYRISDYDYRHDLDSTSNDPVGPPPSGDRYPAYFDRQKFVTHDFNVRATVKLPGDVSLTTRYDWLDSTIDTEADFLSRKESGNTRSHMFGGTVTWNPANWWWTRGNVNYVLSTVDTASDNYPTPVAGFLRSFDNDYATVNLATGMAIDDKTDAELLYTWMQANNHRDVSASSLSYGSRFTENGVRLQVARRLDKHTKIAAGYGYFDNDEGFAGGEYDYDVHIITTSVEFEY